MEVIEVTEREVEVIEVVERGPAGPQGIQGPSGASSWNEISGKPSTFPPSSHTHPISEVVSLQGSLDLKANLESPALTGTPTATTAAAGTNTTQIATTAFTLANRGDRYLTTSTSSHSITTGSKTFVVQSGLSYTPTQDVTIVYDAARHMHGIVTSYSGTSLVINVESVEGSGGPFTDWTINVGGLLTAQGALLEVNNLSDVSNPATALTNIGGVPTSRSISAGTGLTGGGDLTANRTLAVSYGTTAGTAAEGNDSRLSDARSPLAHASTHHTGGTDAIAPNNISAAWQQTISTLSLGNTTHSASAGRNQLILLTLTSGLGAGIILPDTGNAEGDRFAVRLDAAVSQGVTIRTSNYSLVVSGPSVGRTRSLIYTSGAWVEFPLTESHSHPTSDISGTWGPTFAVSRGSSLTSGPFTFDQSWATAATTYTALQVNVTDAASAAGSLLQDWQVGGSSVASINKSGAGAFRTLSANNGTLTASAPVLDLSQTWNASGVTFRALLVNVTNTASASASLLADFQVGGATQFSIRRDGASLGTYYRFTNLDAGLYVHSVGGQEVAFGIAPNHWFTITSTRLRLSGDISLGRSGSLGQAVDCVLVRDAAATLALRDLANPQAFRIYNTFTDASNHERGFMRWSSNVFQIGTERLGTGSARSLELSVNGNRRFFIGTDGGVGVGSTTGLLAANGLYVDVPANSSSLTSPTVTIRGSTSVTLDNGGDPILRVASSRVMFGGTTSSFPALKQSSTTLQVRLADDSAFAPFECAGLTLNGNLTASTRNIVTDTTTGTRIGTATTQLLGFWNAAPSAQPAAVADATDAASTQARLNDLLARLRTIGIIAT